MNHVETLAKTLMFKDFPLRELNKLGQIAREETHPKGAVLFREGEVGDMLYVIVLGSVRIIKRNHHGVEEDVALMATGSSFGEMAVVNDHHVRGATLVTQEPTVLLAFAKQDIDRLAEADHVLGLHFHKALTTALARRLRATSLDASFYRELARELRGHVLRDAVA